jgi:hypothetical protein
MNPCSSLNERLSLIHSLDYGEYAASSYAAQNYIAGRGSRYPLGRRLGKNFLTQLQHWSGAVMCPACLCGGEAAGHNALRGSGPHRKRALWGAMTQTGSPDPRIDLVCITSSCPRQFSKLQTPSRCLASPPRSGFDATSLQHFDAGELGPSSSG